MTSYCCFFCPVKDHSDKKLNDVCPICGERYDFPLNKAPKKIGQYVIKKSLGRGFYGAVYFAEKGVLKNKCVVKVVPKVIYDKFDKNFEQECTLHAEIADGANHIVGIRECDVADVVFEGKKERTIECYISELDYVKGVMLGDILDGSVRVSSSAITQIVIDLLRIREEFEKKKRNHNDFHGQNIMVSFLDSTTRRVDAIDDSIKVVAIDLGSAADESKSEGKVRLGDLKQIAFHIDTLLDRLLEKSEQVSDRDYRVALALQGIIHGLQVDKDKNRSIEYDLLINQIRDSYYRSTLGAWTPWRTPLRLSNFSSYYNALALEPWNIPALLVDPEDRWLKKITQAGPQIITGMRGCGKTHLLRSLELHARAARRNNESNEKIVERLKKDGFVAFFVSAQRLLDIRPSSSFRLEQKLTRIYIYYCLQVVRALLHLRDVDSDLISEGAVHFLTRSISSHIEGIGHINVCGSLEDLDRELERLAIMSNRDKLNPVTHTPESLFSNLAENIRRCSPVWENSSVFFLLDDVSTRFLDIDKIESLLSKLLFQQTQCAFKFTSEWQTIELGLTSQASIHPINQGRDVGVFDLGADVLNLIQARGVGFVEKVLVHRSKYYGSHPKYSPKEILGSTSLEVIAREIAQTKRTSAFRKQVYRGINCLKSVCVGDIGDVVKLYEEILRVYSNAAKLPVDAIKQSECFQDMSSRRLYDLNRRASKSKDCAKSFAEASYELLVKSFRENPKRLRQYTSIYVRVTAGDDESKRKQIDQLRELIDAGVFVFSGGAARKKTRDSDPHLQFKLLFRKLYGLASYIGVSNRDRFELSGADLEEWLDYPERGKEILLRNLGGGLEDEGDLQDEFDSSPIEFEDALDSDVTEAPKQASLFDVKNDDYLQESPAVNFTEKPFSYSVDEVDLKTLADIELDTVFTGLGFEERTFEANRLLANVCKPTKVIAAKYQLAGFSEEILGCWGKSDVEIIDADIDYLSTTAMGPKALIDVSGLSKPLFFLAIVSQLKKHKEVYVSHGVAEEHYPLQGQIKDILASQKSSDPYHLLGVLGEILKGEKGPYRSVSLLQADSDITRRRALLTFASPKHERVFSLLDDREFDQIDLVAPSSNSPRAKISALASSVIAKSYQNVTCRKIDTNDLVSLINYFDEVYTKSYTRGGANFEIGLTGSKMQAVAAAVLATSRRVSQVWYVKPSSFDEARFSKGFDGVKIYRLSVP